MPRYHVSYARLNRLTVYRQICRFLTRAVLPVFLAIYLAACAGGPHRPGMPVSQEEAAYRSHAKRYYAPPGPPSDPWGPYIREASSRFDVPETWIRAVIYQESGGHLYDHSGQLITSIPGAMGLMQLMPPTYDELKAQYRLGPDPYDPHDNILAGTAYIRQMYEIYGSPGFLAAYNYGPGSLDNYLKTGRALPRETRQYVANIGRRIKGVTPVNRSAADLMVARYEASPPPAASRIAVRNKWRQNSQKRRAYKSRDIQVAQAPVRASGGRVRTGAKHVLRANIKRATYRTHVKTGGWTGTTAAKPIPIGHYLKATPVKKRTVRSKARVTPKALPSLRKTPKRKSAK